MAEILVPLDGSGMAEQVLPCAIMLGRGLPADIVLLRATSAPPDAISVLNNVGIQAAAILQALEREAEDYLSRTAADLRTRGLNVQTVACTGPAADCILDYAENTGVELIVMATHGYTGISRWTYGSVAERVLQTSRAPVLMLKAEEGRVPEDHTGPACRRILVPLDGSAIAELVLPVAGRLACAVNAEMILFHVPIVMVIDSLGEWRVPSHGVFETAERDAQAYLDGVAQRLTAEGVKVTTAQQIGAVAQSIVDYAESNQVDLIAMCARKVGLGRWRLGSVADRVAAAGRPVLLVRAE